MKEEKETNKRIPFEIFHNIAALKFELGTLNFELY